MRTLSIALLCPLLLISLCMTRTVDAENGTKATVDNGGLIQFECPHFIPKISKVKWYNDKDRHLISAFPYQPYYVSLNDSTEDEKRMLFNDNGKVKRNYEADVFENVEPGKVLERFTLFNNTDVIFAIDKDTDLNHQFAIDAQGVLTVQRPLDREKDRRHILRILAISDRPSPRTSTATMTVVVHDVNDNAPTLKDDQVMVWDDFKVSEIIEVIGRDADDRRKGNGPPYHFRMAPSASDEVKEMFQVKHWPHGLRGDGTAFVTWKVDPSTYERGELKKQYLIPIVIKDGGTPMMTGTSTLTVTIEDRDATAQAPPFLFFARADKYATVYRYGTQDQAMQVGKIPATVQDLNYYRFINDTFKWKDSPHPQFVLNAESGMVTMMAGTPAGTYDLSFWSKRNMLYKSGIKSARIVPLTMQVLVRDVPDEAFANSATMKITGLTPEGLITALQYIRYNADTVDVRDALQKDITYLSIQKVQENPSITQVTFVMIVEKNGPETSPKRCYFQRKIDLENWVHRFSDIIAALLGAETVELVNDGQCGKIGHGEKPAEQKLLIFSTPTMVETKHISFVGITTQVKCSHIDKLDFQIPVGSTSDCEKWIYNRCSVYEQSMHNPPSSVIPDTTTQHANTPHKDFECPWPDTEFSSEQTGFPTLYPHAVAP